MPSTDISTPAAEQQSRSLRALLATAILTPHLVVSATVGESSAEATGGAVVLGVAVGVAASSVIGRSEFGPATEYDDLRVTVGALGSVLFLTAALWMLLPEAAFRVIPWFGLAFMWALSLVSVCRDIVWSKVF